MNEEIKRKLQEYIDSGLYSDAEIEKIKKKLIADAAKEFDINPLSTTETPTESFWGKVGNIARDKVNEEEGEDGDPVKIFDNLPELDLSLDCDFNFLAVAQFGPRKNIPNTVKWFVEEFKDEKDGLVVKTNIAKN